MNTILIEYENDLHFPCAAKASAGGRVAYGFGQTWDEAKLKAVAKLDVLLKQPEPPKPQEIELP